MTPPRAPPALDLPAADAPLPAILASAWELLAAGAADPAQAAHWPVLATVGTDAAPDARVVVLRQVDALRRELSLHSDRRAGKIAQLLARPRACLVLHDAGRDLQLRLWGHTRLHLDDPAAHTAWETLGMASRRSYLAPQIPGTPVSAPDPNLPPAFIDRLPTATEAEPGRAHFALVVLQTQALEWLRLDRRGHQRARFEWDDHGQLSATWLRP